MATDDHASPAPERGLRRDVWIAVGLVALAVLLLAIFAVFITSFAGEFLIVVKGMTLLPVFVAAVVLTTITAFVLALRSRRRGVFLANVSSQLPRGLHIAWLIVWSLITIAMALPILSMGRTLGLGALGAIPAPVLVLAALPYVGYAAFFLANGITTLLGLARRRPTRMLRGSVLVGMPFFLLFASFAAIAANWNPQWTDGVEHTVVYAPNDQPGRAYRIPAMLVLPDDTVLAFAESRQEAMADLLDIDVVLRRSTDGGRTFTPIQVVEDRGTDTVHSPAPVYDTSTDTVWLPFCVNYQTLYIASSRDHGATWSEPRNLSAELAIPAGTWCHNGPGNGIQLTTGRLVIPTMQDDPRALVSDDHGATWRLGSSMGAGEEPQVFATLDDRVCANLRNALGAQRIVTCSHDGALTWDPWHLDEQLPDAGTQGSIMRYSGAGDQQRNRVLFANPGAPYRGEMTLRLSYDDGVNWPVSRLMYQGAAGYSQIGVLSDHTILVLFETGRYDLRESLTLARVDLGWLTQGTDS